MKTIFITLAILAAISVSCIAGDGAVPAPSAPVAGLEKALFSESWTQCAGRFHYTFRNDGTFSLDGTLLTGSWKVQGDEMILQWSNNWIVDRVKFDAARQVFRSDRGDEFDLHGTELGVRLAAAAE